MKLVDNGQEPKGTRAVEMPDGEVAILTWGDDWWGISRETGPGQVHVYELRTNVSAAEVMDALRRYAGPA